MRYTAPAPKVTEWKVMTYCKLRCKKTSYRKHCTVCDTAQIRFGETRFQRCTVEIKMRHVRHFCWVHHYWVHSVQMSAINRLSSTRMWIYSITDVVCGLTVRERDTDQKDVKKSDIRISGWLKSTYEIIRMIQITRLDETLPQLSYQGEWGIYWFIYQPKAREVFLKYVCVFLL